jgi:epoxyqueuosine reductase QueG
MNKPVREANFGVDGAAAKDPIIAYGKRKGALAVGIADVEALQKIAPEGFSPRDIMPRVRSVIAIGVGGPTLGAWGVSAKTMGFMGSSEGLAYKIAYGTAYFIEREFGAPSIYCPPDSDQEGGARIPFQSLKLHAELAGLGARSLAGDILLHPEFGMMYYGSVFSELELPADAPLAANPCPAPSCVKMYREIGRTPCMKFCPVDCLSGEIDANGDQASMDYDMYRCAEMSQQYEIVPNVLHDAMATDDPDERTNIMFGEVSKMLFYKLSVSSGGLLGQCFECMRVCPIATKAPLADGIKRGAERRAAKKAAG